MNWISTKVFSGFCFVYLLALTFPFQLEAQDRPRPFPTIADSTSREDTKRMLSTVSGRNALILPLVNYNAYDGFMLGGVISNYLDSPSGFTYTVAPFYAFASKRVTGSASLAYNILGDKGDIFDRIKIGMDIRAYSFNEDSLHMTKDQFYKVAPEIAFYKDVQKAGSIIEHRLSYRFISIHRRYTNSFSPEEFERINNHYYVNEIRYEQNRIHDFNPTRSVAFVHQGNDVIKLFAMRQQEYAYYNNFKIKLRLSGSYVNKEPEADNARISISPNGTPSFILLQRDYTFDENLVGRSSIRGGSDEGLWSQQIYAKDAGLRSTVPIFDDFGKWMIGLSGDVEFPIDLPIKFAFYYDLAIYKSGIDDAISSAWTGGFSIPLIGDNLAFYFPIINSSKINDKHETAGDSYWNKIAFTLKLKNPERVVDRHFN